MTENPPVVAAPQESHPFISNKNLLIMMLIFGGGFGGIGGFQALETSSLDDRMASLTEEATARGARQDAIIKTLERMDESLGKVAEGVNGHAVQLGDQGARLKVLEERMSRFQESYRADRDMLIEQINELKKR